MKQAWNINCFVVIYLLHADQHPRRKKMVSNKFSTISLWKQCKKTNECGNKNNCTGDYYLRSLGDS